LRQEVLDAWLEGRAQGLGRLKPGADLDLGSLRQVSEAAGARTVVLSVLTRTGTFQGPDEYVPRPPDEIISSPEERPDYVIPRTGRNEFREGVDLDLLVVDAATSRVVTHRRVSYPAAGRAGAGEAIEPLVHEAVRGLTRGER
jgi:hypothetical protein